MFRCHGSCDLECSAVVQFSEMAVLSLVETNIGVPSNATMHAGCLGILWERVTGDRDSAYGQIQSI